MAKTAASPPSTSILTVQSSKPSRPMLRSHVQSHGGSSPQHCSFTIGPHISCRAVAAPAHLLRRDSAQSQVQAGRYNARHWDHRQSARRRSWPACGRQCTCRAGRLTPSGAPRRYGRCKCDAGYLWLDQHATASPSSQTRQGGGAEPRRPVLSGQTARTTALVARPPSGTSSSKPITTVTSFKRYPTACF